MLVDCRLLFLVCLRRLCLLVAERRSLFVVCLLVVGSLLFVSSLLLIVCCLSFVVRGLSFNVCCPLIVD